MEPSKEITNVETALGFFREFINAVTHNKPHICGWDIVDPAISALLDTSGFPHEISKTAAFDLVVGWMSSLAEENRQDQSTREHLQKATDILRENKDLLCQDDVWDSWPPTGTFKFPIVVDIWRKDPNYGLEGHAYYYTMQHLYDYDWERTQCLANTRTRYVPVKWKQVE